MWWTLSPGKMEAQKSTQKGQVGFSKRGPSAHCVNAPMLGLWVWS